MGSVEETEDLTTDVLLSGLDVVDDTLVGGQHDVAELSGWQDLVNELLEVLELEVESWGDDTALVKSTVEVDDDLAGSGIVNDLELVDVTVLLHKSEELDDNLGDWSKENLKGIDCKLFERREKAITFSSIIACKRT